MLSANRLFFKIEYEIDRSNRHRIVHKSGKTGLFAIFPVPLQNDIHVFTSFFCYSKEICFIVFWLSKALHRVNRAHRYVKICVINAFYFFPSLRVGGILQILQSDWFRKRAVFYDIAR